MRVSIAGAGNVGRSIARELIANGHQVLLIEKDRSAIKPDSVPGAEWIEADACELQTLEEAELDRCDVSIASTGDDKANLVDSPARQDGVRRAAHRRPRRTIPETSGCSTRSGASTFRFRRRA